MGLNIRQHIRLGNLGLFGIGGHKELFTDNGVQLAETLSWNTGDRLSGLAGKRPSEHVTGEESFLTDNGGAIS